MKERLYLACKGLTYGVVSSYVYPHVRDNLFVPYPTVSAGYFFAFANLKLMLASFFYYSLI